VGAAVMGEPQYGEPQYSEPQQSQAHRPDWSARADGRPAETEGKTGGSLPAPPLCSEPPPPPPASHLPPPSYSRLFGIDWILSLLLERLSDKHDHWLISVEGMGGLGKTAAGREGRRTPGHDGRFAGIAWVTAKHDFYTDAAVLSTMLSSSSPSSSSWIASADQIEDPSAEPLPPSERREAIRASSARRSYLVVIDNWM